jgi:hypothetical protein
MRYVCLLAVLLGYARADLASPRHPSEKEIRNSPLLGALRKKPLPIVPSPRIEVASGVTQQPSTLDTRGSYVPVTRAIGELHAKGPGTVTVEDRSERVIAGPFICTLPAPPQDPGIAVRRYLVSVKRCYEAVLKNNPRTSGQLSLQIRVGADGSILDVEPDLAGMSDPDPSFVACIVRAVSAWHLPSADTDYDIHLPFSFSPR